MQRVKSIKLKVTDLFVLDGAWRAVATSLFCIFYFGLCIKVSADCRTNMNASKLSIPTPKYASECLRGCFLFVCLF